ncbi:MAG: DEAD/DEAH box helicase [Mariprofundaceae bacterium]|nr:DEAD/DEAH box helicase [Mariprofundaceae bacterium]
MTTPTLFSELGLSEPMQQAITALGYEQPTPIQAQTIPLLLEGRDVLGQAQTGTGKTAAFALPLISRLDMNAKLPQILVLAPTRELAIQVAEAFQQYGHHVPGFHVLPVYGGQSYDVQLRQLKRHPQVIVGTPGRVMDHIRRGTLKLDALQAMVLDEADEMLRMGFIDDVDWILEHTPKTRQTALFSATMPNQIRRIAEAHLNKPQQVTIEQKTTTASTIHQRYWMVSGKNKMDALTRILEFEPFDGVLIFVRTKTATVEVAERLEARGYSATALNGDIQQSQRERIVGQLKNGKLDIVVATDVAARGLDVERISHVINYDIPHDTESYVHRIGRTGRAGRKGDAILFVAPREQRMLSAIERATRQKVEQLVMPTTEQINDRRIAEFKQRITDTLANAGLESFASIIEQYEQEHDVPAQEIAAALAKMMQGESPLLLSAQEKHIEQRNRHDRPARPETPEDRRPSIKRMQRETGGGDAGFERPIRSDRPDRSERPVRMERPRDVEAGKERFRLEVGSSHGVQASHIVGAIANEAGLSGEYIGRVDIHEDYSTVDLPEGMPKHVFDDLQKTHICGHPMNITKMGGSSKQSGSRKPFERKSFSHKPGRGKPDARGGKPGGRSAGGKSAGAKHGGPKRKPRDK